MRMLRKKSAIETPKKSSYSSSSTLNIECLLKIFSYLPIAERFKVERVCRLWREASQSGWIGFQTLHFRKGLWDLPDNTKVTDRILRAVLLRCGKNLRTIQFPHDPRKNEYCVGISLTQKGLENIPKVCLNLKKLDFGLRNISTSVLSKLSTSTTNLKHIGVTINHNTGDEHFSKLFKAMKTLKSVTLFCRDSANISKCLKDLSKNSIEVLVICNCYAFSGSGNIQRLLDAFINEAPAFKKLQRLAIHQVHHKISAWSCNSWAESFISLEIFGCGLFHNQGTFNLLSLSNLQELQFSNNFGATDEFLIAISRSCRKLVKLVLGDEGCHSMTDMGLSAVVLNLNLQELEIKEVYNFQGTDLPYMNSLRYLRCNLCENIEEVIYARMLLSAVADSRTFQLTVSYFDKPLFEQVPIFSGTLLDQTATQIHQDQTNRFSVFTRLSSEYDENFQRIIRTKSILLDYQ